MSVIRQPGEGISESTDEQAKSLAVEALQDTGRWRQRQSEFLDIDTTLGYPSRFLSRLF
jgi:hypothetical protein